MMKVKKIEVSSLPSCCYVCKFFKESNVDTFWHTIKQVLGIATPMIRYQCLATDDKIDFEIIRPTDLRLHRNCPLTLVADTKLEQISASIEWLRTLDSENSGFKEMKELTISLMEEYKDITNNQESHTKDTSSES